MRALEERAAVHGDWRDKVPKGREIGGRERSRKK